MRVYLDADDTLLHFREHAVAWGVPRWEGSWYTTARDNWTDEQRYIQDKTNEVMRRPEFWLAMPVALGAHGLIAAASFHGPVSVLTALPSFADGDAELQDMIRRAKVQRAWQALHVPPDNVIVCARAHKVRYAFDHFEGKQSVLVDDAEQNCREWREANGVAFLADPNDLGEAIDFIKGL